MQLETLLRRPGTSINEYGKGAAQAAPFLFRKISFPNIHDVGGHAY
jgi:hypothetical protein